MNFYNKLFENNWFEIITALKNKEKVNKHVLLLRLFQVNVRFIKFYYPIWN